MVHVHSLSLTMAVPVLSTHPSPRSRYPSHATKHVRQLAALSSSLKAMDRGKSLAVDPPAPRGCMASPQMEIGSRYIGRRWITVP